jgi:uncharacterized membrane protein YphA (DoxX/SURF4 family)
MAWLTILIELLGRLAVLLPTFVTIVSGPRMAVLLVALFKVHLPMGQLNQAPGLDRNRREGRTGCL